MAKKEVTVPVEPFDDWVVVLVEEQGEMSEGGIFIPKEAREDVQEVLYRVVAIGPGRPTGETRKPVKVEVGDLVLVKRALAVKCAFQDIIYWLVQDQDIVARVRKA